MRISGGRARGIRLAVPKGEAVRPATDGLRQAVFSSLGERVAGARFLDLFAGSGAYGLEALSRGAVGGAWVEKHRRTCELLRGNVTAVCRSLQRDEAGLVVQCGDAAAVPWPAGNPAPDLVLVDPPYPLIDKLAPRIFARLRELLDPAADPLVVFEMPGDCELSAEGFELVKRLGKGAGQPTAVIYRLAAAPR